MTLPPSDHFNGKTFFQRHHDEALRRRDFWRWRFTAKPKPWPEKLALTQNGPEYGPHPGELLITWIGHASFLIQHEDLNFLVDPVFSERASPLPWLGPRRAHPPGVTMDALPRIDAVFISHDHYDHCDLPTLRRLARRNDPLFVAPLRHRDLLESIGTDRIVELDWWQVYRFHGAINFCLTPAKHWSNRFGSPRNYRLWGGFFLNLESKRIWFAGDSGYDGEIFRAVRARYGVPEVALIPIGAYEPRWFMAPMHMNPAEAVQAHLDIGAQLSIGMHWGTFQLTDEGREDPVQALAAARDVAGVSPEEFRVMAPGECIRFVG